MHSPFQMHVTASLLSSTPPLPYIISPFLNSLAVEVLVDAAANIWASVDGQP